MLSEVAIRVVGVSKCYHIYDEPIDRLKQFFLPRLQSAIGLRAKKYFREYWALREANIEIKKGETVGIVGRNGSGKSTLLQLICGTLNPSGGEISTSGRISALLELGSGFNPEFTGRENIYLNASILGLSNEEIDLRLSEFVDFSGIGDFLDQPIKTYSSGMILRLAFSVAVNVNPEILVVDEALAVGDELFQRKCFAKIKKLQENGATILFVSHSSAQVVELCDRAILVENGEVIFSGPAKTTVTIYQKLLNTPLAQPKEVVAYVLSSGSGVESKIAVQRDLSSSEVEGFDTGLLPQSRVVYQELGARIETQKIINANDVQVNNLIRGSYYIYQYSVKFLENARDVRFGMSIRTTTGLLICGAFTSNEFRSAGAIECVQAGSTLTVCFSFNCNLNPGMYFINSGVYGVVDSEEILMHRIVDGLAFRVQSIEGDLQIGPAWLEVMSNVR